MIQDSTPETSRNHFNPKLEEMKQIVLFQIEKYSFWFPEKCSSTKDGFQARTNQRMIYSFQFENFSKLKASNFVNEMKMVTCSVWFYHLSKSWLRSYTKITFILDG